MTGGRWQVASDRWHVPGDMCQVTSDRWQVVGGRCYCIRLKQYG